MALNAGDLFAGYTIQAELGRGGMGTVYLAVHPRLPRQDALKLLSGHLSTDDRFRARFEREADLAARLFHRNIVAVHDRGSEGGQLWIAMQYVEGSDASQALRLAGGLGLDPARVVRIITEVAAALDFAHRRHMLHRDVKPANILLAPPEVGSDDDESVDEESVLLSDFGIAKLIDENQNLTGTGNLLATLAYASPEQIEGKPFDHRVDIYSLGCVLYELLTGSVPFPNENAFATMRAHLAQPPPAPSARRSELTDFDHVVAKAMAKDPAERFQSCRQLALAAAGALNLMGGAGAGSGSDSAAARPTTVLDLSRSGSAPNSAQPHSLVSHSTAGLSSGSQPGYSQPVTASRPPYVIRVLRSGAQDSAPSAQLGEVNTANLPQEDRIAVEELIYRMRFFELPDQLPQHQPIPDDVFEQISVATAYQRHTVGYYRGGSARPTELDRMVGVLERSAAWQQTSWQGGGRRQIAPTGTDPAAPTMRGMPAAGASGPGASGPGAGGPGGSGPVAGTGPTDLGSRAPTGPTESYPHSDQAAHHLSPGNSGNHNNVNHNHANYHYLSHSNYGSQLGGPPSTDQAAQPTRKRPAVLIAASAAVVIIVALGVYLLTRDRGPNSPGAQSSSSVDTSAEAAAALTAPGSDTDSNSDTDPNSNPDPASNTAPAAGGSTITADLDNNVAYLDLEQPGSQGRVSFEAKAGDRAFVNVPESTFNNDCEPLTLRSSDDEILASGCIFGGVGNIDGTLLPYDGQYAIVVDPTDDSAGGNITVELFLSQDHQDAIEIDGSPYTADVSIPGGRTDLTFNGVSGQRIFVSLPASSFADDCDILSLRDSNNEIIDTGCTFDGVAFIDATELPSDGEYHLVIDPTGTATGTGDIQITTATVISQPIAIDGPPVTVMLPNPGDLEELSFSATAGQLIFIAIPQSTFNDECDLVKLRDTNSNDLASGCVFGGVGFVDTFEILSDGDYVIDVNPPAASVGSVEVVLTAATRTDAAIETNGEPTTAVIAKPGDYTVFSFDGVADQQITLAVTGSTMPDQCAALTIVDSDGNELANECIYGSGGEPTELTLPTDGQYYLYVNPEGSDVGSAEIVLTG